MSPIMKVTRISLIDLLEKFFKNAKVNRRTALFVTIIICELNNK